ncbi:homeobox protein wariai [Phtheirospermum japonicum]|uniref:Homeobox protein wariai n=1 Tax=Phtheirospermum japonicum TaxID=374723 RepID=A0A830BPH1_9LAMI|nr:homeobox protein wariai [Phtheirospermum japonicum]
MEVDEGGESGGGDGGASVEAEKKNSPDGEPKLKRKMKTPSQLEILEKTYAMETYPSEALRAELSVKLGLSDRQLQMWFCHRRLKDRKAPPEKKPKKNAPSPAVAAGLSGGIAHEMAGSDAGVAKDGGPGLSLYGDTDPQHKKKRAGHKVGTAVPRISIESPPVRRFYEPPLAISEQRAIRFVEAQLGEPLREDDFGVKWRLMKEERAAAEMVVQVWRRRRRTRRTGNLKLKRKMKTPSQLEILEKTYAMETYPSEALRAELSVKLGLSDRQLQMWFCHRRLKDRKAPPEKKPKKNAPSPAVAAGLSGGIAHEMAGSDAGVAKDGGPGLSLYGDTDPQHKKKRAGHKVGTAVPRISIESPPVRRFYEPPLAISEQRAIRFVEAQLGNR